MTNGESAIKWESRLDNALLQREIAEGRMSAALAVLESVHKMRRDFLYDHKDQSTDAITTQEFVDIEDRAWKILLAQDPSAKTVAKALDSVSYPRKGSTMPTLFDAVWREFLLRLKDESGKERTDALITARTSVNSRKYMDEQVRKNILAIIDSLGATGLAK